MSAQRQTQEWDGGKIDSAAAVGNALDFLSLPRLSEEAIRVISGSSELGKFKSALQTCVDGGPVAAETKRYVTGLVRCMSKVAQQSLETLGFKDVPLEALLYIGARNGMAFKNALDSAINPKSPNRDGGLSLVAASIREAMDGLPSSVTDKPQAAARPPMQPVKGDERPERDIHPGQEIDETSSSEEGKVGASEYLSTHVYGGNAALCFNAAKTASNKHHTIVVDGASLAGAKNYDWKNAVSIQLGHKELPLLYGVMFGWRQSVKFDAHGADNNKVFEIERQDGKYFAKVMGKVGGKAVARAVPIGSSDALPIMEIVFAQIVKEAPKELQGSPHLIHQMMQAAQNIKPL